jgi:flagellin-like hook-associated protein FlgL
MDKEEDIKKIDLFDYKIAGNLTAVVGLVVSIVTGMWTLFSTYSEINDNIDGLRSDISIVQVKIDGMNENLDKESKKVDMMLEILLDKTD